MNFRLFKSWHIYLVGSAAILVYFYGIHQVFHPKYGATGFGWLAQTWNGRNELSHGPLVPFIIAYLVWRERKIFNLSDANKQWAGILLIVFGILIYWSSVRTMQQRLMVGSLPIVLYGAILHLWGWKAMKVMLIPIGLIYFVVPMPGITQATNSLQLMASNGASFMATLFGADVVAEGNLLASGGSSDWGFDVAEGCSGIRSLMAMGLVTAIYAQLTEHTWWRRGVLLVCALPLAVFANILRVTSIVLIAEYGNADFAGNLYHDYSSFIFFPCALAGLVLTSQLLNFSSHFGSKVVRVTAKNNDDSVEKNGK